MFPDVADDTVMVVKVNDVEAMNVLEDIGKRAEGSPSPFCSISEMSKRVMFPQPTDICIYPITSIRPLGEGAGNSRGVV
jgi:hypothetical protein